MAKGKLAEKPIPTTKVKVKDLIPDENVLMQAVALIEETPIVGRDGKEYKLGIRQRIFCEKYLEFRGNGVEAVFAAGYKVKDARVAAAIASENLTKPNIIAFVNSQLEKAGFNDENVTREHLFLMNQYGDLHAKKGAIDMYYKIRGTYAPERSVSVNVNVSPQNPTALKLAQEFEEKLKTEL